MTRINRTTLSLTVLALSALLLAGCGNLFQLNEVNFTAGMEPAPLGYEVDEDEITITSRTFTFRSASGALGATVDGYSVQFVDADGDPVSAGSSTGSLGVFVPPGITCDEPDEDRGCTANSAGATFASGPPVQSAAVQMLSASVAQAHIAAGGPTNWRALVTFHGTSTTAVDFEVTKEYEIVVPN